MNRTKICILILIGCTALSIIYYYIYLSLCDVCGYYEFKGIVVWGRELNVDEQKLNTDLKAEGKDYFCTYFDRYFNKSFYKHRYHCEAESLEGLDEETD